MVRVLAAIALLATPALADRDMCAPGVKHHGAPVDLDVKHADVRDVLRMLADTAHVNLVIGEDVAGFVTLVLHHVAWDAATCAIAGTQHLRITVEDNILVVRRDK